MIQLSQQIKNDLLSKVQNFEYLVNIDDVIYIASRKQMLEVSEESTPSKQYYEDADLKISDLSEKIDLKSKKPQLSNVSITFKNFDVQNGRFSDKFKNAMGKKIKIYFKTQSCKTLSECVHLTELKITRVNHDHKQIKLSANDVNIDSVLLDIPKAEHLLFRDINTFDHYSAKPVPILYGHLESAPAQVYKENVGDGTFKVKLLPDVSYFDNSEIGGVAKYNPNHILDVPEIDNGTITLEKLQLVRQNNVQINIGDHLCDVTCLPYHLTRSKISNPSQSAGNLGTLVQHTSPQWFAQDNHILLNVDVQAHKNETIENSTLWVSINEKPISEETISYAIISTSTSGGQIGYEGYWFLGSQWSQISELHHDVMMLEDYYIKNNVDKTQYSLGVKRFKFKPLSGYKLNDSLGDDDNPNVFSDVHFVGSVAVTQEDPHGGYDDEHVATFIHSAYASPTYDEDAVNSNTFTNDVGYPLSLKNYIIGGPPDDVNFLNRFSRTSILLRGQDDFGGETPIWKDYRSSFLSPHKYGSSNNDNATGDENWNSFVSTYKTDYTNIYPTVDASILSLYHFIDSEQGSFFATGPNVRVNIQSDWSDLELRRVWSNKDIFEKDFFVNAKGKLGGVESNVENIGIGHIIVKHDGLSTNDIDFGHNAGGHQNLTFTELYKYLTSFEHKTKLINGEIYELMLASKHVYDHIQFPDGATGETTFVYDIHVEDLSFHGEDQPNLSSSSDAYPQHNHFIYVDEDGQGDYVTHGTAWMIRFNGKVFGDYIWTVGLDNNVERRALRGFRLVYGKKRYEGEDLVEIISAPDEYSAEFELFNDNNGYSYDAWTPSGGAFVPYGRSYLSWESSQGDSITSKRLLERPHEIIQHLTSTSSPSTIPLDEDKINTIMELIPSFKMAFSVTKQENTKDIIEEICRQSPLYYRYRSRDKKIVVDLLPILIPSADGTIDVKKTTNFSYSKTKLEDSAMGGVVVRYGYNYATKNLDKQTARRDAGFRRPEYKEYYGIDDLSSYFVELKTPYIQDKASAELLRDYYYELHKNQHLVCKFELPTSEGLEYEVGDIIQFNGNPNNTKPYGYSLDEEWTLLHQTVLPLFFITKVSKSLFRVKIECTQIHTLNLTLAPATLLGDINLDGRVTWEGDNNDLDILSDMVANAITFDNPMGYSQEQLANADITGDGSIGIQDLIGFIMMFDVDF